MVDGTQHILQYGRNGETEITYRITLHDGVPFEKEMVFEEEVLAPVNCIIEQGTKKQMCIRDRKRTCRSLSRIHFKKATLLRIYQ